MGSVKNGSVVLKLKIVLSIEGSAYRITATAERTQNLNGEILQICLSGRSWAEVLKSGFVDYTAADDSGFSKLHRVCECIVVIAAAGQVESTGARVPDDITSVGIPHAQNVIRAELIVHSRSGSGSPEFGNRGI